ncbi:MAG: hypothetical protein UR65_C0023G0004 [Candidatus Moranbacteria bacterium GW2011_GWE2_35_164]|nr:MAG: hypothetical protein UR65_C0023G0004 [Candidatus Moranbacteria bacterium GW2011_GWE2_35_164]KKP81667.1 MAG: hypothetical protein UR83_C0069G0002 [Candidatus Moranbacteria bacterium GW2011_GWF2_35_54]
MTFNKSNIVKYMEINQLKTVILDQREEIELQLKTSIKRDVDLVKIKKYLSHPNILIISGVRRCGKSTLAAMALEGENFAHINFDDNELLNFKDQDFNKLMQAFYEIYGSDVEYFIFDEIQNIPGWELFAAKLRRTKKVIITGSNANLLSMELSTHLTGRHIDYYLMPFSFAEYLRYQGVNYKPNDIFVTKKKAQINQHLNQYIKLGGFPEVYKFGDVMAENIFDDIINKDVLIRKQIKYKAEFKKIAAYLLANYSQEFTYSKLKNVFDIKNVQTLKNYIEYLRESYLIFILERFSYKLKQQIIAPKKIYAIDNALLGKTSAEFSDNIGKKIENIVFLELMRREARDGKKKTIFYFQDHAGREVDFVVKNGKKVAKLIQVAYSLAQIKTKERELASLLIASEQLTCDNLCIVTMEEEGNEEIDGKKIKIISLSQFLLDVE